MDERERVGHLLRRFGLGASPAALEAGLKLGSEKFKRRLLDYASEAERVHPLRFAFRKDQDAEPGAWRVKNHWTYHFMTTGTPLREKLALFWHDHFAVDDEGGGDGMMMLEYMQLLRRNPLGRFPDLMTQMAKCPAFMEMLSMRENTRAKPNENFGRELLELYTLGEGNYSEGDVKDASRCFTGWTYENRYWHGEKSHNQRLRLLESHGMSPSGSSVVDAWHDRGLKTVRGQTAAFTGEQLIEMLTKSDRCAEFLCEKLWSYFAFPNPDKAVLRPLLSAYKQTHGSVKAVLFAIAEHPAFWSAQCVREQVKSPVDYAIGLCRAMGSAEHLPGIIGLDRPFDDPIPAAAWEQLNGTTWSMFQMGLDLLKPPSVAGWDWGPAWITSNTMLWRTKFGGYASWEPRDEERQKWGPGPGLRALVRYVKARDPQTVESLARSLCLALDVALDPVAHSALVEVLTKHGGLEPARSGNDDWMGGHLWRGLRLLQAAPAMHVH